MRHSAMIKCSVVGVCGSICKNSYSWLLHFLLVQCSTEKLRISSSLAVFVILCRITTERHRAEVRRAVSDDRLAAIAGWLVFSSFLLIDAVLARYMLSSCVRPSVCISHASVVPRRLNVGSFKQHHIIVGAETCLLMFFPLVLSQCCCL